MSIEHYPHIPAVIVLYAKNMVKLTMEQVGI